MYVDWSVELGADDPVLDFPWIGEASSSDKTGSGNTASDHAGFDAVGHDDAGPDEVVREQAGSAHTPLRYYDLKADPSLIDQLQEARSSSELRKFLLRMNAAGFPLQSAKCDHWFTREISEEEEIFAAPCKCGSYVDLLFTTAERQLSFVGHEEFAAKLCDLLKSAPEMPASAEVMVRRCFYAATESSTDTERDVGNGEDQAAGDTNQNADSPTTGFYFTVYVSGFGETEAQARQQWSIALTLVQHALVQSSKLFKPLAANQRE